VAEAVLMCKLADRAPQAVQMIAETPVVVPVP
jgi:hypothetical protein